MNKIKTNIAIFTLIGILVAPQLALADSKDWTLTSGFASGAANSQGTTTASSASTPTDQSSAICDAIFAGDPTNIFKEVICSFTRLVALSIANLASEMTCVIQSVGNGSNYVSDITFITSGSGSCTAKSKSLGSTGVNVFEDKINNTKIFSASTLTTALTPSSGTSATAKGFNLTRGLMGLAAVVALFIFAFANIFHIEINTYAVKKAIPSILIAIIGGWLSIYIIFLLSKAVDFMYQLSIFSPTQTLHPMLNIFGGNFGGLNANDPSSSMTLVFDVGSKLIGGGTGYSFFSGFLGSIMLIIPALAVFAFEYVLALRPFAVQILTIVAPLAFCCIILPQTQAFFKKWWTFLLIAMFFTPAVNFVFYILNLFGSPNDVITFSALWALKIVAIIALIRMPFTIQSDVQKIAGALSKTSFGAALGLARFSGQDNQNKNQTGKVQGIDLASDKTLASSQAKGLIAPNTAGRRLDLKTSLERSSGKSDQNVFAKPNRNILPNVREIAQIASSANSGRSADLMMRSVKDLSGDTLKTIIAHSDTKLWQNGGLVSKLKEQNGQLLNEEGVALRADSARKLVRMSQIVEHGQIANPDALRFLAGKGLLDNVPAPVIKKAITDGILAENDLQATFAGRSKKVFDRIVAGPEPDKSSFLSLSQAKVLMARDEKDYQTGFKDLSGLFADVVKDPIIIPPPPPPVIKNIVGQMKSGDDEVFEKNGMYFLSRLGEVGRASQKEIADTLRAGGVKPQTAISIAQNPKIDFSDAKSYMTNQGQTPENLSALREGFVNRDLSDNLAGNISNLVADQKILLNKGIAKKISQNFASEGGKNLEDIKSSMSSIVEKIDKQIVPEDIEKVNKEIEKYYPGSAIKSSLADGTSTAGDTKQKAQSILETVENIIKADLDTETIAKNPSAVNDAIEKSVGEKIRGAVSGEVASDSAFDSQLTQISSTGKV
jgi:predicted RNA binding protein with dsRBD fold (UPF0201 family)